MSIHLRRAVEVAAAGAVITVVALSAGPAAAAAPSAAPATTSSPSAAAAGWLSRQFVDASGQPSASGDHLISTFGSSVFPDFGGTADAVFALAAAKVASTKIDGALTYLAAHVDDYTSLNDTSGAPGPYDGSVAKLAIAAMVGGVDPTSFGGRNLLQALKDDECTTVSAPTDPNDFTTPTCPAVGAAHNIFSSVSESLAILAEARGATEHGNQYAPSTAAVDYFLLLQCPGGGFTGATTHCTDDADASVDETAYAAAALAALGGHASELTKANDWLVGQRKAGGYWDVQGGPDVDSTGLATAALEAAGQDVSGSREWLASQQVTTGPSVGAGASRGALKYQGAFDASSSIKATADGLLGLAPDSSLATLTATGAAATAPILALAPATAGHGSVRAGATQSVTAGGFQAGETVQGVLHSAPVAIGSAKAGASGTVTLSFTVPSTLAPGSHTVVLTGATSGLSTTSAAFTVTAAATTAPTTPSQEGTAAPNTCDSAQLACTGRDGRQTHRELVLGLGLLVAGAGALFAGRRRRA